jgi:SAM-dependent methyltransferase
MTDGYETGAYWEKRKHLIYYQYFRYMVHCLLDEGGSIIDVGSGNAPYLEWFDWAGRRVSVDLKTPYRSDRVEGLRGNILDLDFDQTFDLCTCMQVLEHVTDPEPFARRLFDLGRLVLISVPYKWKEASKHHPNDPVDRNKVAAWFGRKPNYSLVVREPFGGKRSERMFALFDRTDPDRRFRSKDIKPLHPL